MVGLVCQDEFITFMLEQLDVKTDVEFLKIMKLYTERLDQGSRALKLRKVKADGEGWRVWRGS